MNTCKMNGKMLIGTVFVLTLVVFFNEVSAARHINIGGLFDSEDESQEKAFRYVVEAINAEREMLPKHILVAKTEKVPQHDSFAVSTALCNMLKEGVIGVFGPTSGTTSRHVQSVCDSKEVPHVETRMDPDQGRGNCLINLYPHPAALSKVFVELVQAWNWKQFTIMYENSDSFPRLSELFKLYDHKGHVITFKQLDYGTGNYRPILHHVKMSGDTNFVLDCSIEKLHDILLQAQQIGIMSDQHSYIITTPDMHTLDMEPFQHGGANITGIRLIDPEDEDVIELAELWNSKTAEEGESQAEPLVPEKIRTEIALMFDAVLVFVEGLKEINTTKFHDQTFDCEQDDSWEHGFTMINYMKTNYVKGLTRGIKFDHAGFRTDFLLDIVELSGVGIQKIGTWNSTEGLNLTRANQVFQIPANDGSLVNRSFIVLTALSPPYGMLKDSSLKLEGNDRFEGFGIEVIQEVAKLLGFNYTFELQDDGVYGSLDRKTQKWNGMVKKLLDHEADLAITDLTITSDRESAVDFTMPFMNLGISILYRKPTKQPPSLFSFMSPFSNEVWLFLGSAYLGVSVLLFVMARIAPKEWQNPYPCIEEPDHLENQFSMPNSLWFTVGSVLQQGSELAPIAISTRMIAGVWWFFTLIIVSSYTANLAAFLTIESITPLIDNAEDLANNPHGITYGAKRDGSTLSFFKDSDYPTYQKMYQFMQDHPECLTSSNNEGVERVKQENYAYLMESTSIEYIIERECDVTQIGDLLDDKGYGIAMRKNSAYRNTLSTAVLKLQEQGKLQAMKIKWWKEKRGGGACSGVEPDSSGALALTILNVGGVFVVLVAGSLLAIIVTVIQWTCDIWFYARSQKDEGTDDKPEDLGIANVGGVFVLLVGGCIVATITACGEMICGIIKNSYQHKVPFRQELLDEWRFVAKCSGDTKPVRHRRSFSRSCRSRSRSIASGSSKSKEELNHVFGLKVPENGNGNTKMA